MDPAFVERHWDALPNLRKLRDKGYFGRLGTTTPPQSPVAWSSFITGLPPGEHGIFDFVHRDASTLQPFSSMGRTEASTRTLKLGPYLLPLSAGKVVSLRKGNPFWQVLSDHGVDVTVVHMPTNYPPVESGHALAGMGTPDLQGTLGTFTFFTDEPSEMPRNTPGGRVITVHLTDGHTVLPLAGPPNTLRTDQAISSVALTVDVDYDHRAARFQVGNELRVLKEGEWSEWIAADFALIPHVSSSRGEFRLFVKQLRPTFQLYVSAVNADPVSPALPIAAPPNWGRDIARETGRFYTMGTPEDTAALRQHVLSHEEFRQQTHAVFEEERSLLRYCLRHYKDGMLFFYFSAVDQNSHILWGKYESELLDVYHQVDECIGEVSAKQPDAEVIVMSDHGFTSFARAANLNSWLSHRGFLALSAAAHDNSSLSDIDWTSTDAYAVGLNGLYVNLKGREAHGSVSAGQAQRALIANLREQLLAWRDPLNGKKVVSGVYESNAAPDNLAVAPDLIVGYSPGYRASWQTAVGGTPVEELMDNDDEWIGDHCIDPAAVPGVLFASVQINGAPMGIKDVTKFIVGYFD